jgi:hypothetical protein
MAKHSGKSARRNISGEQAIRGKNVVAAIDFHRTRLYPADAPPGERPEQVVDVDPEAHSREISHRAGNPDGTYEAGNQDYWREITEALAPAGAILLLGHGNDKANASHQWVAYAEKHATDVAAKVVADVRADIDTLTSKDILRFGQRYFGLDPARLGKDPGSEPRN